MSSPAESSSSPETTVSGAARHLGGHSHWPTEIIVGGINVVNVGSTCTDKKLKVLELP